MYTNSKYIFVVLSLGLLLQASMVFAPPISDKPVTESYCQSFQDTKNFKDRTNCQSVHRCFGQFQSELEKNLIEGTLNCVMGVMKPMTDPLHYGGPKLWMESPMQRLVGLMSEGKPSKPAKVIFSKPQGPLGCPIMITDPEPMLYQKLSQDPPLDSTFQKLLELLIKMAKQSGPLGNRCYWRYLGDGQELYHRVLGPYNYKVYDKDGYNFDRLLEQMFYCRQFSVCVDEYQSKGSPLPGEEGSIAAADQFFSCTKRTFTTANPVRQSFRLSTLPLVEPELTHVEVAIDAVATFAKSVACYLILPLDC